MARRKGLVVDPAEALNQKILADREQRIIEQEVSESMDLGLQIQRPRATTAAELLRDEWDKKTFGDAPKITTRVVYGPDPLVNNCPEFHERLEKYGLEEVADAFRSLILSKGENALPDPIMRKGVRASIREFGKEATAQAFYDRVMRIPQRTVEVEVDGGELDPLLSNPMREAVARYGTPGMAPKFLSELCIQTLGARGYVIVKDENGNPVKVGTLIMGEIPEDLAERRRQHFADESRRALREQEQSYFESAARAIHDESAVDVAPLGTGDSMHSNRAGILRDERGREVSTDSYVGRDLDGGIRIGGDA